MHLRFNANLGTVELNGQDPVVLTQSERRALELLSGNPHRVISRDQILDAVSGGGSDKSDRNVDFLINRLRRKISDDARRPRYIATRYGEGYVWIADAPLQLLDIAAADVVIGPVLGLETLADRDAAAATARTIAALLSTVFGADRKSVYAPDCPSPHQFGTAAPRHAVELTFFSDRGRVSCIVAGKVFRTGDVLVARRLDLEKIGPNRQDLAHLCRDVADALWRTEITAPSRREPLAVALYEVADRDSLPQQAVETASHRQIHTFFMEQERSVHAKWEANGRRLRKMLERTPDDPELKILLALNTHSKYVMSGIRIFSGGEDPRLADEDEIEELVTAALPFLRNDPEYAIVSGKLLHFLRRGYDDLAYELCESAYARSLAVGRSLAMIGQMRSFFGETDTAVQCIDQALNLSRPGSNAHLQALVIKCQALAAAGRWKPLASARREMAGANRIAGLMMAPMFEEPGKPSLSARTAAFLVQRRRAPAMLMHLHYVGARLFRDPERGTSLMRSLTSILTHRYGNQIVPDEVLGAYPGLLAR